MSIALLSAVSIACVEAAIAMPVVTAAAANTQPAQTEIEEPVIEDATPAKTLSLEDGARR